MTASGLDGIGDLGELVERAVAQHDVPALRKVGAYARAMVRAGEAAAQFVEFAERGAPSSLRERDKARYQRRFEALVGAITEFAAAKAALK